MGEEVNDNKQFEESITEMMEAFIPSEELVEMQKTLVESESFQKLFAMNNKTLEKLKKAHEFEIFENIFELNKAVISIFPKLIQKEKKSIIEAFKKINDSNFDIVKMEKPLNKIKGIIKKNPSSQTKLILQKLIPYFKGELPYKKQSELPGGLEAKEYNSKIVTYIMQDIANLFEVHIRTIQRIASQYENDYKDYL